MKHHFDECVERVTAAKDASHAKGHIREDCVEECKFPVFFACFGLGGSIPQPTPDTRGLNFKSYIPKSRSAGFGTIGMWGSWVLEREKEGESGCVFVLLMLMLTWGLC